MANEATTTKATPAPAERPNEVQARHLVGRLAERHGLDPTRLLPILRDTVFKPPKEDGVEGPPFSDYELAAALTLADRYQLDPFAKELYVTRSHGKLLVIVPVDGWVSIVNRSPEYQGCEFSYDWRTDEKGARELISITCTMHLSNRKYPVVVTEFMSECYRDTGPWNSHGARMLRHKTFIQAGRLALGLGGIHDEDEAERIIEGETVEVRGTARTQRLAGRQQAQISAPAELPTPMLVDTSFTPEEAPIQGLAPAAQSELHLGAPVDAPTKTAVAAQDEAALRKQLWSQWIMLEGKLSAPQVAEVQKFAGVKKVHHSISVDAMTALIAEGRKVLGLAEKGGGA